MEGIRGTFWGISWAMSLTVIKIIVFSNQILLAFRKQIIALKKGIFAPPAPPSERQEGRLLPPAPLSGVPGFHSALH